MAKVPMTTRLKAVTSKVIASRRGVSKGVLHKNTGSRKVSRLAAQLKKATA